MKNYTNNNEPNSYWGAECTETLEFLGKLSKLHTGKKVKKVSKKVKK